MSRCVASSTEISDYLIEFIDDVTVIFSDINVILCGDLNHFDTSLLQSSHDLFDKVLMPTRGTSILDRFLVSRSLDQIYMDASVGPPLTSRRRGSHCQILLSPVNIDTNTDCKEYRTLYDLKSCHIADFITRLNVCSFHELYHVNDLDKKLEIFYTLFQSCLSVIPSKSIAMSTRDKPWMSAYLKDLISKRWFAYRCKNFHMYNIYKHKCKEEIKKCKMSWVERSRRSSRNIWSVVSDVKGNNVKNPLAPILHEFSDAMSAANAINESFAKHFHSEDRFPYHSSDTTSNHNDDDWCPLTSPHDVFLFLENLSTNKATGSDGICNRFYKLASPYICEPLCNIINSIIIQCYVPKDLKKCIVSPIPKCSPVSFENLRPITLLSVPAKLLEHHILSTMRTAFYERVPSFQFAYKRNSCTTSCLVTLHHIITELLEKPDVTGCMLLNYDFSKAFDTISHKVLLQKLRLLQFC